MSKDFITNSLKNRNIIYIGDFTSLRELEGLTYNLPVKYETIRPIDGNLYILNAESDTIDTLARYVNKKQAPAGMFPWSQNCPVLVIFQNWELLAWIIHYNSLRSPDNLNGGHPKIWIQN